VRVCEPGAGRWERWVECEESSVTEDPWWKLFFSRPSRPIGVYTARQDGRDLHSRGI
jgi:hypothetical protein